MQSCDVSDEHHQAEKATDAAGQSVDARREGTMPAQLTWLHTGYLVERSSSEQSQHMAVECDSEVYHSA